MSNIHDENVAKIAHCIIVFCTQELGTCFDDTGILVSRCRNFRIFSQDILGYLGVFRRHKMRENREIQKLYHMAKVDCNIVISYFFYFLYISTNTVTEQV